MNRDIKRLYESNAVVGRRGSWVRPLCLSVFFSFAFCFSMNAVQMSDPLVISDPVLGGNTPSLATNNSNTAVAVWLTRIDDHDLVFASVCSAGSWSFPLMISSYGFDANSPSVAMDSMGDAIAVWCRKSGVNDVGIVFQAAMYTHSQGSWGQPIDLSSNEDKIISPFIRMNEAGDAGVIWLQHNYVNGYKPVVSHYSKSAGTWSSPFQLSTDDSSADNPWVWMNEVGQGIATWTSIGEDGMRIQGSLYNGGEWHYAGNLSEEGEEADCCHSKIENSGYGIAVWAARVNDNWIYKGVPCFAGSWGPIQTVFTEFTKGDQTSFGYNAKGRGHLAWSGTKTGHVKSRFYIGGLWTEEEILSPLSDYCQNVSLDINNVDKSAVIWKRRDDQSLQMAVFANGGWSSGQNVSGAFPCTDRSSVSLNDVDTVVVVYEGVADATSAPNNTIVATTGVIESPPQ